MFQGPINNGLKNGTCNFWNKNNNCRSRGTCKWKHVCTWCKGDHRAPSCTSNSKSKWLGQYKSAIKSSANSVWGDKSGSINRTASPKTDNARLISQILIWIPIQYRIRILIMILGLKNFLTKIKKSKCSIVEIQGKKYIYDVLNYIPHWCFDPNRTIPPNQKSTELYHDQVQQSILH